DFRVPLLGDAQALEELVAAARGLRARDAEVRGVKDEILDYRQAAVGIGALRHDPDSPPYRRRRGHHIRSRDQRLACRRANARGEDADGGRLTGAVRAEHAEELAVADGEVERVDGDHSTSCGGV